MCLDLLVWLRVVGCLGILISLTWYLGFAGLVSFGWVLRVAFCLIVGVCSGVSALFALVFILYLLFTYFKYVCVDTLLMCFVMLDFVFDIGYRLRILLYLVLVLVLGCFVFGFDYIC